MFKYLINETLFLFYALYIDNTEHSIDRSIDRSRDRERERESEKRGPQNHVYKQAKNIMVLHM